MEELKSIQCELNAPKGQFNSFGKYKYRSCEDILAAVKPLLNKYKCALTLSDEVVYVGNRFYIKATAMLKNSVGDKEVTTAYAREEESKKGMDGSQVTGASSSYARKYALNGLFAIDDTKDADALNTSADYTQQQQRTGQQQAQPAQTQVHMTGNVLKKAIEEANKENSIEELKVFWEKCFAKYPELRNNEQFGNALFQRASALCIEEVGKCNKEDDILSLISRWGEVWPSVVSENTPAGNAIIVKRNSFAA